MLPYKGTAFIYAAQLIVRCSYFVNALGNAIHSKRMNGFCCINKNEITIMKSSNKTNNAKFGSGPSKATFGDPNKKAESPGKKSKDPIVTGARQDVNKPDLSKNKSGK